MAKTKSEQKFNFSKNIYYQKVNIKSSNRLQSINKNLKIQIEFAGKGRFSREERCRYNYRLFRHKFINHQGRRRKHLMMD